MGARAASYRLPLPHEATLLVSPGGGTTECRPQAAADLCVVAGSGRQWGLSTGGRRSKESTMFDAFEVTVHGYVASDAVLRESPDWAPFAYFRIGVTPRFRTADGWREGNSEFVTCKVWRDLAFDVGRSIRRGMPVIVRGRLSTEEFVRKDGSRGFANVIHAHSVGVELRRGIVTFTKVDRRELSEAEAATHIDAPPAAAVGPENAADPWEITAPQSQPDDAASAPQDASPSSSQAQHSERAYELAPF
ncbi:single-stranded DNA-binding protein [Buchananella hordeovulneris]|nr:single-stranded DNA-binding protein [Buchananella hordeovulneris]